MSDIASTFTAILSVFDSQGKRITKILAASLLLLAIVALGIFSIAQYASFHAGIVKETISNLKELSSLPNETRPPIEDLRRSFELVESRSLTAMKIAEGPIRFLNGMSFRGETPGSELQERTAWAVLPWVILFGVAILFDRSRASVTLGQRWRQYRPTMLGVAVFQALLAWLMPEHSSRLVNNLLPHVPLFLIALIFVKFEKSKP